MELGWGPAFRSNWGTRFRVRRPVGVARRLALAVAVLAALFGPGAAALWNITPDVSDIQQRVAAAAGEHKVPLLGEGDVPKLLSQAVVATEDERFYSHHGIDSIALGRAPLSDALTLTLCQGGSPITEHLF